MLTCLQLVMLLLRSKGSDTDFLRCHDCSSFDNDLAIVGSKWRVKGGMEQAFAMGFSEHSWCSISNDKTSATTTIVPESM
jgi:hypothetical protein